MSRVRLSDTPWFKEIPSFLEPPWTRPTGYGTMKVDHAYATEFLNALRFVTVDESRIGSTELLAKIIKLHRIDRRTYLRGDQRWCQYGFRHKVPTPCPTYCDEDRRLDPWHSCLLMASFSGITGIAIRQLNLRGDGEGDWAQQDTTSYCREWDASIALGATARHLDASALQLDRLMHAELPPMRDIERPTGMCDAYDQDFIWNEPTYGEVEIIDQVTDTTLERSLKTLWVVSKQVEGACSCKGRSCQVRGFLHDYREVYEALESYHTEIVDVASELPFMFDTLKTRAEIDKSIQFAFDTMQPTDEWWSDMKQYGVKHRTTQLNNTRYAAVSKAAEGRYTRSWTNDDGNWEYDPSSLTWYEGRRVHWIIPTHKLRIALATWCVAMRIERDRRESH